MEAHFKHQLTNRKKKYTRHIRPCIFCFLHHPSTTPTVLTFSLDFSCLCHVSKFSCSDYHFSRWSCCSMSTLNRWEERPHDFKAKLGRFIFMLPWVLCTLLTLILVLFFFISFFFLFETIYYGEIVMLLNKISTDSENVDGLSKNGITHILSVYNNAKPVLEVSILHLSCLSF